MKPTPNPQSFTSRKWQLMNETTVNIAYLDASNDYISQDDVRGIFYTLERAPWWKEVDRDTYVFRPGEPWRYETVTGKAVEGTTAPDGKLGNNIYRPDGEFYTDTRWEPKEQPKVGDLISDFNQLLDLPDETVLQHQSATGSVVLWDKERKVLVFNTGQYTIDLYDSQVKIIFIPEKRGQQ